MTGFAPFRDKVNALVSLGRPTIAFGLAQPDQEILESLKRGGRYARIILVGPPAIRSVREFKLIIDEQPEKRIASMLVGNDVDGLIRGTLADTPTRDAYNSLTGEKAVANPVLCDAGPGREFWLTLTSNLDGWTREARFCEAKAVAAFVKEWDLEPLIAVYAAVRQWQPNMQGTLGMLMQTFDDAEWIVAKLKSSGYVAKNWTIDLNPAVEQGYNVHVPVNGMLGNQIFRVVLFCGGRILAAPMLGLTRPYDDTSRTEKDMEFHVKWLTAFINKTKLHHSD
jgi:predicted methyltransferase MtxX (methanogen marker protein 4)